MKESEFKLTQIEFPILKQQMIDYFTQKASDEEKKEAMKRLGIEMNDNKKPEDYVEEITSKVNALTDYDVALDIFGDIAKEEARQEKEKE